MQSGVNKKQQEQAQNGAGPSHLTETMKEIQDIVQIAEQHDKAEARDVAFQRLSALLFSGGEPLTPKEQALIDSMLLDVVEFVELSIRAKLAEQLARAKNVPRGILTYLANDDVNVAHPLLRNSSDLLDEDLVGIVERRSKEHRLCIASRKSVSSHVNDALIDKGEPDVVLKVLDNPGAELSRKAADSLVRLSEKAEALRKPLLRRPEVDASHAQIMFWWVSASLRSDILKRYKVDEAILDDALRAATQSATEEVRDTASIRSALRMVAGRATASINDFLSMLKGDNQLDLIPSFSKLVSISQATAQKIIEDKGGEPLAVACKAMQLDRQQFTRLFLLLDAKRSGGPRPTGQLASISEAFDKISDTEALNALRYWECQELLKAA